MADQSADAPPPADAPPADAPPVDAPQHVTPERIAPDEVEGPTPGPSDEQPQFEAVTEPAKVMRIGSMVKQLLEEVRTVSLDEASRERLAEVYERSIVELGEALSPDLREELTQLNLPFDEDEVPSEAELRVAKAQLVGWLEGLFHGIQASLMAQQVAARQQLEEMRQLPQRAARQHGAERPGTYL